jgi:hypothetical protein
VKFVLALALALASTSAMASSNAVQCQQFMEQNLIERTRERFNDPKNFQLKSVGKFTTKDRDTYTMTVYYENTLTRNRGMTTAKLRASSTECSWLEINFYEFNR